MLDLDLYIRQMGLVNPELLDFNILIVGAGSIGSWTCLALLKLGCQNVKVLDFDKIEVHNAGSQVYSSLDVGKNKVEALQERLIGLVETLPTVEIKEIREGKTAFLKDYNIVISAVDNIATRKIIFQGLKNTDKTFIDGRMAGNALQIFTIAMDSPERVKFYEDTLFPSEEEDLTSCSERSIVYNCFIISGYICDIVSQIANGKLPPKELEVDLLNFSLYT